MRLRLRFRQCGGQPFRMTGGLVRRRSGVVRGTMGLRFLRIYGRGCALRPAPARMIKPLVRSVGRAVLSHAAGTRSVREGVVRGTRGASISVDLWPEVCPPPCPRPREKPFLRSVGRAIFSHGVGNRSVGGGGVRGTVGASIPADLWPRVCPPPGPRPHHEAIFASSGEGRPFACFRTRPVVGRMVRGTRGLRLLRI